MHRNSTAAEPGIARIYLDLFFLVKSWSGLPTIQEPDRCDDLIWAGPNNLPEKTVPYVRDVINFVERGELYSEYGWKTNGE